MGQNPFHNPAATWSPVAGMVGRPPGTGWMQSSVSASQPPNFGSPGITPSTKTPDVQEVRQDRVPHLKQAFQSRPQIERSKDYILVVDNASSTVEGVGLTNLQKPTSSERIKLEMSAVAVDQVKEKLDQESHQRPSTQGKEKAEMQMEKISIYDYACSTAEEGGTSKGRLQELKSSERIELEAPFIAASQPPIFGPTGITPSIKNPDVQDVRQDRDTHLQQSCQSQPQAERSKDDLLLVKNASSTVEGVGSTKLQNSMSSERIELEMSAAAAGRYFSWRPDDQEKEKQDKKSNQQQSTRGKEKAEMQREKISVSDSACSTAGDRVTSEGKLHELVYSERIEVEAPFIADSQDEGRQGISHLGQPSHAQDKSRVQCNNISMVRDDPDTAKGDIRHGKLQESMSSMRDESEALLLTDFEEGRQAQASNQMQPSHGKAKAKRPQGQISTMENASNTLVGGETRERKLQKLISSENELEAAAMPLIKDSSCGVLLDGVGNTVAPIAPMTSSFHDQADSSSISSSTLDWASTFDDVSSTGAIYWGTSETMVKVGNYFVEQKQSATMEAIIKKYGDIAKDCQYSSTMIRSSAVQGVCEVIEGLQIPLEQLSHERLETDTCFVKDALLMGLNVKWLEERLEEVSETIDSIKEYKHIRDLWKENMGKMRDLKKELGLKEIENWKCEREVEKLWCLFEEATLEVKQKEGAICDIKSRCKAFPKHLLDDLY